MPATVGRGHTSVETGPKQTTADHSRSAGRACFGKGRGDGPQASPRPKVEMGFGRKKTDHPGQFGYLSLTAA